MPTKIEWVRNPDGSKGETWNPIRGCSRVSAGCQNCYAERTAHRFSGPGQPYEGLTVLGKNGPRWTGEVRVIPEHLGKPLRWTKPRMVFVNSMSDLFHDALDTETIAKIFAVMMRSERHTFQVLTKRPARATSALREIYGGGDPLPNVWIGTSIENQETADERIPHLLQIPAAVRFLSMEPLLGRVELTSIPANLDRSDGTSPKCDSFDALRGRGIALPGDFAVFTDDKFPSVDWVIAGGESGPGARPMHPRWAKLIRDHCQRTGVPYFFKQHGEWQPVAEDPSEVPSSTLEHVFDDGTISFRVGKHAAGRTLDGRTWDEMPEVRT